MKRKICILWLAMLLLSAASCADSSSDHDARSSGVGSGEQTTATAQQSMTDSESSGGGKTSGSSNTAGAVLPEEANDALIAYLRSDSYDSLVDSILPTSAAEEAKHGKILIGNYFFGFETIACEDAKILECSRLPEDQTQKLAAFWATGFSVKGLSADFTAEDGYDTVVTAVCSVPSDGADTETIRYRFTRRLELLKIKNDRWIVVPSSDTTTNNMEPI